MKSRLPLIAASLAAALAASAANATAIVYNVNQSIGGGSVVGTITTDGATGVLTASDITAWDLMLNGVGASYHLKDTDVAAAKVVIGNSLTATASDLFYNFSGATGDFFLLQDHYSSGATYYCNSNGFTACFTGKSDVPQSISDPSAQYDHIASGNQIIGVAARGVPEPASWAMMLIGLGALGMALRTRRPAARPA